MSNKVCKVTFEGTQEQENQLLECISSLKGHKGAVMQILQEAQEIYGYLPQEVLETISIEIDTPLEELYGIATFYAQFSFNPKGRYKIAVCLGTACYVKGAGDIFDRISKRLGIKSGECTDDGKFSLEACRCIGACGLAPVIMINEEVYGRLTVDEVDKVIDKYLELD